MIYELRQPIEVTTDLGDGIAVLVIDYGAWVNTCWVVILSDGRVRHFDATQITVRLNHTYQMRQPHRSSDQ